MSSVFGFATVTKTLELAKERFATLLHDKDRDRTECVVFQQRIALSILNCTGNLIVEQRKQTI